MRTILIQIADYDATMFLSLESVAVRYPGATAARAAVTGVSLGCSRGRSAC